MKTHRNLRSCSGLVLLLLAGTMPLSQALAQEGNRQKRNTQRPTLIQKIGGFFTQGPRNVERTRATQRPYRSGDTLYQNTSMEMNGGPQQVTLTSTSTASTSTIIPRTGDQFLQVPEQEEVLATATDLPPVFQPNREEKRETPQLASLRESPYATPGKPLDRSKLPVAQWSNSPGQVVSPFPPHHHLDVRGLPSNSLAKDPANGQIFRLPY